MTRSTDSERQTDGLKFNLSKILLAEMQFYLADDILIEVPV